MVVIKRANIFELLAIDSIGITNDCCTYITYIIIFYDMV